MKKISAFTLVELLVVVVIISVLASIIGISFTYLSPKKLEMQARKLAGDLSLVRQRAVSEQDDFFVYFPFIGGYSINKGISPQQLLENKILDVDSISSVPSQVHFKPDGTAQDSVQIILMYRGNSANITVFDETGFIKWQLQ